MHVKGEAIEAHISDKEAGIISVLYINNRGAHISDKEATYQRCISERYFRSLSGQGHLGKLFKKRTFMVNICK
jgi:hypothetical protein